jgi:transglutaminase-like putative cysteine protease
VSIERAIVTVPLDDPGEGFGPRERLAYSGGWLAPLLIITALVTVGWSVQAADWSDGLNLVLEAIVAGSLLAFLLSLTHWGSGFAFLYSLLANIAFIVVSLSRTLLQVPDTHIGIQQIIERYSSWIYALANHSASSDNLMFVIQLLLIGWWMGHYAMWTLIRHRHVWLAMLPPGLGLLINTYYAATDLTGYILVYLLAVVLLAVRVELTRKEIRWQHQHIRYAPDISIDFMRDGLIFGAVVIALAWVMPQSSTWQLLDPVLEPVRQPWHELGDTWSRAFSNLRYPSLPQASTFGRSLELGGPVALSDRPVFQAQTKDRSYWRAVAFDTYNGRAWQNSGQEVLNAERNQPLPELILGPTYEVTATVRTLSGRQDVLFGPPGMTRASVATYVDVFPTGDSAEKKGPISLIRSRTIMNPNSIYQVVSTLSGATPDTLRLSSNVYPNWVTARYLQIPDSLSSRVRRLALRTTRDATNAYDKASAIERFLRSQYPYNTQIAEPPAGVDAVDYFLFTIRQGYCDYYASSMVMMLRSLGIPARFVAGYAPGTYDAATQSWIVLERNAHAWVEVFFPDAGWVQFEPTASEPLRERPTPTPEPTPGAGPTGSDSPSNDDRDLLTPRDLGDNSGDLFGQNASQAYLAGTSIAVWKILLGVGVALLIVGLLYLAQRREKQVLHPDAGLLDRLYTLFGRWAASLHVPWPASHTPYEHAAALSRALPEAAPPIGRLAHLFVAQQYGKRRLPAETLTEAAQDWRSLRPILWKTWVKTSVNRLIGVIRRR